MLKQTILAAVIASTMAMSARQADDKMEKMGACKTGDTMKLKAWLGDSEECTADPTIEEFDIVVGECTGIEGGTLPLFVMGEYNATAEAYQAMIYLGDDTCNEENDEEKGPTAVVYDFKGACKTQEGTTVGTVSVMEVMENGDFPCNPADVEEAADDGDDDDDDDDDEGGDDDDDDDIDDDDNEGDNRVDLPGTISVMGYLGDSCDTGAITIDGGAPVPTDGTCVKVSADDAPIGVYAQITLEGDVGSATIHLDEDCALAVATFEKFDAANAECFQDSTGSTASVMIVQ